MTDEASLLAALDAVGPSHPPCKFRAWVDTLSPEAAASVWSAVGDEAKPLQKIADAIRKNGHRVGRDTIGNHRNGTCTACQSTKT